MVNLQPCFRTPGNRCVKSGIPSRFFNLGMLCVSGLLAAAAPSNEATINAAKAKGLVLHAGQGDINIRAARQGAVKVTAHTFPGSGGPCTPSAVLDQKMVTVKLEAGPMGGLCHADLDILVPQQFDLDLTVDNGTVKTTGTHGSLKLTSHQGNAVLGGKYSHMEATLDKGSMSAQGLVGDSIIILDDGNAQLWYESPKGSVNVTVKRGNVTVIAPVKQAAVRVDVLHGTAQVGVASSESAAFTIDGTIEQGNLSVRSR